MWREKNNESCIFCQYIGGVVFLHSIETQKKVCYLIAKCLLKEIIGLYLTLKVSDMVDVIITGQFYQTK